MGRKGDIETKSLSARVPMETYIHFLSNAHKSKSTLSAYLCDLLNDISKPEKFSNGGDLRKHFNELAEKTYSNELNDKNNKLASENALLRGQIQKQNRDIVRWQEKLAEQKDTIIFFKDEFLSEKNKNTELKGEIERLNVKIAGLTSNRK